MSDVLKAIIAASAIGLVLAVLASVVTQPRSYKDIAADFAAQCVDDDGDGAWVASSGMTLEEFCRGVGAFKALRQARHDHPEAF